MSLNNIGNKVQNLVIGIIMAVIMLAVGIALGPTVISSIADINATTLGSTPLSTVIILLATYIPTFYYLGIVVSAILAFWAAVRYS